MPRIITLLKKNVFLRRSIKLSLDPLLVYQREERLYFLNSQRNSHFLVVKRTGCADLNLAGLLCPLSQVQWRRQWLFSPANQWSAEFTRHVLVTVLFAWNLGRGGTKKSTMSSGTPPPPHKKVTCTVLYHAVEKRHMWPLALCGKELHVHSS